jgi:hypothetical protein
MRIALFFRLMILSLCISLLAFALLPQTTLIGALKIMALGVVISIAVAAFYPELRGVKKGDKVAVVSDTSVPGFLGRQGKASMSGRKNQKIRINLQNGSEATGVIESYCGMISPAKIRILYEERLAE